MPGRSPRDAVQAVCTNDTKPKGKIDLPPASKDWPETSKAARSVSSEKYVRFIQHYSVIYGAVYGEPFLPWQT
jgi:hypothetical protein